MSYPSAYFLNADKTVASVSVYLPVDSGVADTLSFLRERFGVLNPDAKITVSGVNEEDWANSWKQYYKPIEIGKRLVVVPMWEKYDKDLYELQKRQKNLGLIKSLYMPCTVISGMAGLAFKHLGVDGSISDTVSLVMYLIAAAVLFYGLYKTVTDRSIEEKKQLNEKFQEDYVCPHCKRFLGFQPYNILSQNKNCPYNKCKWDT